MKNIVHRVLGKTPDFDPQDPSFVQNPYPTFDFLRQREPIHQTKAGVWALLRYKDVIDALKDERFGNAPSPYAVVHKKNRGRYVCADVANTILPFLDAPEHDVPRKLVLQAYRHTLKEAALDFEAIADGVLKKSPAGERMKLVEDFATPYALAVMCRLFALPLSDQKQLAHWSRCFLYLFMAIPSEAILNQLEEALTEFRAYFKDRLEERRDLSGNDLLSKLLATGSGGEKLAENQIIDNAMLLFADGIGNVDRGIGNAVWCLTGQKDYWPLLKAQPDAVRHAVEECLRFESPAQYIGRIAREDIRIGGKTIKKHMAVLLVLGSANRDPEMFDNPDAFTIQRHPNKHLSSGRAQHSCVGGGLVKSEMHAALNVLLKQPGTITRAIKQGEWMPRPGHRWLKELEIRFIR